VQLIHADLLRIPRSRWFRREPSVEMIALRARWSESLAGRVGASGLGAALAALRASPHRPALYLALEDLEDLARYCAQLGVPLALPPLAPLLAPDGQTAGRPPSSTPALLFAFSASADAAAALAEPAWPVIDAAHGDRFHAGEHALTHFQLPEGLEVAEVFGAATDLESNARFDISLGPDSAHLTRVAVIRDCARPALFRHPVDPSVLAGPARYLGIELTVLPDTNDSREYALVPRLGLALRRAAP